MTERENAADPAVAPDQVTTIAELRAVVQRFVSEREWQQFHAPKNLAMALAIEAAEFMEHFQWMGVEESRRLAGSEQWNAVGEELADIVCYALALANELDIDVTSALREKMRKNEKKYPVERYRGRYK